MSQRGTHPSYRCDEPSGLHNLCSVIYHTEEMTSEEYILKFGAIGVGEPRCMLRTQTPKGTAGIGAGTLDRKNDAE